MTQFGGEKVSYFFNGGESAQCFNIISLCTLFPIYINQKLTPMGLIAVTQLETLGHLELLGFTFGSTQPTRTCIAKLMPMVR